MFLRFFEKFFRKLKCKIIFLNLKYPTVYLRAVIVLLGLRILYPIITDQIIVVYEK